MDWLRRLYRKKQKSHDSTENKFENSLKRDEEFVDIVEGENTVDEEVGGLKDLIASKATEDNVETDRIEVTNGDPPADTDGKQNVNDTTSPKPPPRLHTKKKHVTPFKDTQSARSSNNSSKTIIHQPR